MKQFQSSSINVGRYCKVMKIVLLIIILSDIYIYIYIFLEMSIDEI